jgi:hypothetical protein
MEPRYVVPFIALPMPLLTALWIIFFSGRSRRTGKRKKHGR